MGMCCRYLEFGGAGKYGAFALLQLGVASLITWYIWDLFEGEHLFGDIFDARGAHDSFRNFALMAALIGPAPGEFVRRSETTGQCFDPNGTWIASGEAAVPLLSLNTLEKRLSGEEKRLFIQFMRSMLKWLPEERTTAKQLLQDPWLL
ncbi:hypothetical protein VE03_01828 [Pseudogymnoascus sp. 23342-1-I1]|nr:hypothetical protein VE03_01828 [Pseudogymnoascus sp. 23342-1-I1]